MFNSLEQARQWLYSSPDRLEQVDASERIEVVRITVGEVINAWRTAKWGSFAESTRIFYESKLGSFNHLQNIEVDDIQPQTIDSFIAYLKTPEHLSQCKASRLSFEKELELLKTILRWYLDTFDNAQLKWPFKQRHLAAVFLRHRPEAKPMTMTADEKIRFLEALRLISEELFVFACVQINQILRISEVAAMKYSNIDWDDHTYRITEHVVWARKKGAVPILKPGTKNVKHKTSVIPLRKKSIALFAGIKAKASSNLIFSREGRLLTYKEIYSSYGRACKKAGIPFSGTHVLKHTGATEFLEETGDQLALTQMGNWANVGMAMHYGKISKDRARKAVRIADEKKMF